MNPVTQVSIVDIFFIFYVNTFFRE